MDPGQLGVVCVVVVARLAPVVAVGLGVGVDGLGQLEQFEHRRLDTETSGQEEDQEESRGAAQ